MKVNKVIFTSDFLRVSNSLNRSSFCKNTDWFYRLLNKQLKYSTGLQPEIIEWNENTKSTKIDGHKIYDLMGKIASTEAWAEVFNASANQEVIEYLEPHFNGSLVIGFEVSPFLMDAFSKLNITCLSFIWYPVRFMDDIFFGIRTNNADVFSELKEYQLSESNFYIYADMIRARNLRENKRAEASGNILIGQTKVDRSLINNGKICNFGDFEKQISEVLNKDSLIYRPHPFAAKDNPFILNLISKGQVKVSNNNNNNIYDLLASDDTSKFIAISSGTLVEAKYFEKPTVKFIEQSESFASDESEFSESVYLPIYHEFLNVEFWSKILKPVLNTKNNSSQIPFKANRMRHINCSSWGYNEPEIKQVIEDYT